MDSPTLRKAEISDISNINMTLRLSKAYWGYDEAFVDAFMKVFAIDEGYLNQHTVRVLYEEKQIAGFFCFMFKDQLWELDFFFLHPDYIGKGLGRKLWKACCETSQELGIKEFTLWSDPHAEPFYVKMGCKRIGMKESPVMRNRLCPIMHYKI